MYIYITPLSATHTHTYIVYELHIYITEMDHVVGYTVQHPSGITRNLQVKFLTFKYMHIVLPII